MKFFIKLSLILLVSSVSYGQNKVKFGKVSEQELVQAASLIEPEAAAEVLYDKGNSYFIYSDENGFQFVFERHRRIKIYKKEGYEYGDIEIPFYEATTNTREKVGVIRAVTYNYEDGKTVKSKVTNAEIFEEQLNKYWVVKKFAFPNIKEGSIIEYSYSITSDFIQNLREWEFQSEIPTVWTEYNLRVLEYLDYQRISQGYVPFVINKEGNQVETFTYKYQNASGGRASSGTNSFSSNSTTYKWAAQNVTPLKEEPYMTSIEDYKAKIGFQLISHNFPGSPQKFVAGSYEAMNTDLLDADYYGGALSKSNFLKETVGSIVSGKNEDEVPLAIYSYIKNEFEWNGFTSLYPGNLKETFREKKGNSANLNLLLVMMLREAGYKADPVLLGTRDHGKPHPIYPNKDKLNYVLCYLESGNGGVLLDATRKSLPFGMLPQKCLNGNGWRLSSTNPGWVPLKSAHKNEKIVQIKLNLAEDGSTNGEVILKSRGSNGRSVRNDIQNDGEDKYFTKIDESLLDWSVSETSVEGIDDIYSEVLSNFTISNDENQDADIIYLPLQLYDAYGENPFKSETRIQPIDFPSGFSRKYLLELTIPDNYEVEELPESTVFQLPGRAAMFQLSVNQLGDKVNVVGIFKLKKTFYLPDEYSGIKQFFDLMIQKQSEQIVIKKKS